MCGIAGLLAPRLDPGERAEWLRRMLHALRHRGPSGAAQWDGDGISIGLMRLAIVAPESEARVVSDESGDLRAVMNGEIYNHQALNARLADLGCRVAPGSDAELLPHLYERDPDGFVERLDGMYALAVWDARARRLTLARDRAGEKPLYLARWADGLAFASEPGALVRLPWVSRDPSPQALVRYLAHGFFAGEDSAYRAVRQLPPAHVLVHEATGARARRYWRPWDDVRPTAAGTPPARAIEALRAEVEDAVDSRLPREVPFGVFVSGGVDSSLVAVLASRRTGRGFPTFSLRLPDQGYDESAHARRIAARVGSRHHELTMDAALGEETLEACAERLDQPLGDPSVVPTWALTRLAASHVPVVLTGEGADELFAGYPTYLGHRHAERVLALPAWLRRGALGLARRLRPPHHHVSVPHLVERYLSGLSPDPLERHVAWFGTAPPARAHVLLAPALRAALGPDDVRAHLARFRAELGTAGGEWIRRPGLATYQLLDFELYLSGDLLTKMDRCAMAHGLESRAPFLRPAMVARALALPEDLRLRGTTGKWALKQAARGLVPDEILFRRKQGFSPPFSAWVRGPLRAGVSARLAPERVARAGVLDPAAVTALLSDHLANRAENGRSLWAVLSLQLWAERWLAARPAEPRVRPVEPAVSR